MRNFIILLVLILFTYSIKAEETNFKHLKIYDLSIEAEKAIGTNRNYGIHKKHGEKKAEINLNLGLSYKQIYNVLRIESDVCERQFCTVALDTELGVKFKPVDLYLQHKSEHTLERRFNKKYQNENSVGIRLKFIGE